MALAQDITVMNQYTKRGADGGPGIHGSTPGRYVIDYMSRADAIERLPVMGFRSPRAFIERYMVRADAVEHSPDLDVALNERHRRHPHHDYLAYTGVGFGSWVDDSDPATGPIRRYAASMSEDQLLAASRQIQALYDGVNGSYRAVYKTVLSFSGDYLERNGILDSPKGWPRRADGTIDDDAVERGAYRGRIDQGKLRIAIMHGLERLNLARSGLTYVGVIQVDTAHVHCHLAMATEYDAPGGARKDGRISLGQIDRLRRGLDAQLDEARSVAFMAASEGRERRNLASAVGQWALRLGQSSRSVQQLVSLLPVDQRKWRAASHSRIMRRANNVAQNMVEDALMAMPKELAAWQESVERYIEARHRREGRDDDLPAPAPHHAAKRNDLQEDEDGDRRIRRNKDGSLDDTALRRNAYERMIQRCINELYRRLRHLERSRRITPMMSYMRMDRSDIIRELAAPKDERPNERMASFALRARNYSERLAEHNRLEIEYLRRYWTFKRGIIASGTTNDAIVGDVARYYRQEADYQAMCTDKYRHYMPVVGDTAHWERLWDEQVRPVKARAVHAQAMLLDPAFDEEDMDGAQAQDYAWRNYGMENGADMITTTGRDRITRVLIPTLRLDAEYAEDDLRARARGDGCVIDDGGKAHRGVEHSFWDVRGIDLQDMVDDSIHDEEIGSQVTRQFERAVQMRLGGMVAIQRYAASITARTGITMRSAIAREPAAVNVRDMQEVFKDLKAQTTLPRRLHSRLAQNALIQEQTDAMDDHMSSPDEDVRPDVQTIVNDSVHEEIERLDGGPAGTERGRMHGTDLD